MTGGCLCGGQAGEGIFICPRNVCALGVEVYHGEMSLEVVKAGPEDLMTPIQRLSKTLVEI